MNPAIILNPQKIFPYSAGYIDQEDPHSINNVFIDFLGDLEIILVACDDGDVIGYYTHVIEDVLNHTEIEEEEEENKLHFFELNVGLSAWGLSVHTLARKIAIGSNTQNITIHSFGLNIPSCEFYHQPNTEELQKFREQSYDGPTWRQSEDTLVMTGLGSNIPSVAFCNNDEDLEGKLIAVGTVAGGIYIMNLRTLKPLEYLQVGFCRQYERGGGCWCCPSGLQHSTWGISWLDRKNFLPVSRQIPQDGSGFGHFRFKNAWNGTDKALVVPDSDEIGHISYFPLKPNSAPSTPAKKVIQGVECPFSQEHIDVISSITWTERRRRSRYGSLPPPPGKDVCTAQDLRWHSSWEPRENQTVNGTILETSLGIAHHKYINGAEVAGFSEEKGRHPNMPCPLFVASKKDACIIPPKGTAGQIEPIVGYCNVLGQDVVDGKEDDDPKPWFEDKHMDRLSLQAHIPELGILITATPKGRAAVYTLCQSPDGPDEAPVYFHRLDWMLPFKSQEDAGERPLAKLIGIATGPLQGNLGQWDGIKSRRYRLMLHYSDHTILSYLLQKEEVRINWEDGLVSGPYRELLAAVEKGRMLHRAMGRRPGNYRFNYLFEDEGNEAPFGL